MTMAMKKRRKEGEEKKQKEKKPRTNQKTNLTVLPNLILVKAISRFSATILYCVFSYFVVLLLTIKMNKVAKLHYIVARMGLNCCSGKHVR
jgi:hypothetical protein